MADLNGTNGDDILFGTDEDDTIRGFAGNDFLSGGGGTDLIEGGDDEDTLSGDSFSFLKGADTLTGGAGNDRFEWSVFDGDSTSLTLDVVTDFEGAGVDGGDTLELFPSFFVPSTHLTFGGLHAAPAAGTALGTAGDGVADIFYAFDGGNTLVFGDTNDSGTYDDGDFTVRLNGTQALVAADFGGTEFVIAGTDGDDTINGTAGNDVIFALGGNDTVNGLDGADRIDGGSGDDIINGGDGDDQGDFSGDIALLGGDGNDQINGGAGNDTADGGAGNDLIDGGIGDDILGGGADNDQVTGGTGLDFVFGDAGDDILAGGDDDDALVGGIGNDVLNGGSGNDVLQGEDFFGILGADQLTGGTGFDTFAWAVGSSQSTSQVQDRVTDFEGASVNGGDTLLLRLPPEFNRQLVFRGELAAVPAPNGTLAGGGNGFTDVFFAFSGPDTIVFADSDDDGRFDADDFAVRLTGRQNLVRSDFGETHFVTVGTNGADTINGTEDADEIFALGGNDIVNGNGGNDRIEGGDGNDIANGGNGDDIMVGGLGGDQLNGNAGNDRIDGQDGNDILNGGDGIDRITGGAGTDIIDGGAGRDTVLSGGDGNDIVRGGDGTDTLDGDAGNDQLFGGNDNDSLFGGDGNDIMNGDAGNDDLFGGFGSDQITGGAGIDEIEGEEGADILTGGAGDDQFDFNAGSFQPDSLLSLRDVVNDFQGAAVAGGDVVRLSGDSFAFVGNLNVNPTQGAALPGAGDGITQLGYTVKNNKTFLIADSNDDGALDNNDFVVEFNGVHNFTVDDFDNTDFVIAGTNGDDVITGTEGDDRIFAAGGNDQVLALGGNDEVHGGTGDDFLDGGPGGFDNLFGEEGNDVLTLATSDGGGVASGGDGDDVLFGSNTSFNNFDNSLQGDAGNDELHAGSVGSFLGGGGGSDRLVSGASDDQMEGGRDEFGFDLDGAPDQFVFTGTERWSTEGSFFGDTVSGFQDGSDLFDMRGSGLQFSDLTIVNEDFQTTITSDRGTITIFESFGQEVFIDQNDFLFDPPARLAPDLLV